MIYIKYHSQIPCGSDVWYIAILLQKTLVIKNIYSLETAVLQSAVNKSTKQIYHLFRTSHQLMWMFCKEDRCKYKLLLNPPTEVRRLQEEYIKVARKRKGFYKASSQLNFRWQ